MRNINKTLSILVTLLVTVLFFGCSKDDEKGNYVKLDNVSYAITSAMYSVEDGNLTIQFETANPDVFLYFKGKTAIPVGEMTVSFESQEDNCYIVYSFEEENYFSIDGSADISLSDADYTIVAEGHAQSSSNEYRTYKIHYIGGIMDVTNTGSNAGGGNSSGDAVSSNDFRLGPVFSYIESNGGSGNIKVYCDNNAMGWTASSSEEWCRLSNSVGTGDGAFGFVVERNLSNTDRRARITVVSNDGQKRGAWVFQKPGAYDLVVTPNQLDFEAFGGTKTIHIYAITGLTQHSWTASCNVSWVHLSQTSGYGNTDIQVTVDRNKSSEREAEIVFKSEGNTVRYTTISQKKGNSSNASYLIYDGEEIGMSSSFMVEVMTVFATRYLFYYLSPYEDNVDKCRVALTFQDFASGYPDGTYVIDDDHRVSVRDGNNVLHDAESGSFSITKDGGSYIMNGSGVTRQGVSFSFVFKGKQSSKE